MPEAEPSHSTARWKSLGSFSRLRVATKPQEGLGRGTSGLILSSQYAGEEAFTSGDKTVVVFAMPAFCVSATCGPVLEVVNSVKPEYPDVNFTHVEVYTDLSAPDFAPTPDHLAPAVGPDYWRLPSEPWVFVVDGAGRIAVRFEGSLTPDDLRLELDGTRS